MKILELMYAYGHENILCNHNTTIELTKDSFLTKRGNCILGVNASKACFDLNPNVKKFIKKKKRFVVTINIDNITDSFYGFGSEQLELSSKKDVVFRKSDYTCNRTVLIQCSKSAIDLNHKLIEKIKIPGNIIKITCKKSNPNSIIIHSISGDIIIITVFNRNSFNTVNDYRIIITQF